MAHLIDKRENANNWQDWVNLVLAVWLFIYLGCSTLLGSRDPAGMRGSSASSLPFSR